MPRFPTLLAETDEPLPWIKMGEYTLQFELGELSDFAKEVARKELRETDEVKAVAIKELRELLREEEQNGLVVPLDNDYWLIRFLRPCKFYPDSAFQLIQRYHKYKIKYPEIFENLLPSNEDKIMRQGILTVLPIRDQLGRRVLIAEFGKRWNHKEIAIDQIFKGCILLLEAALTEPETQVHGSVIIFDFDGLSLQQAMQFTPSFAMKLVEFLQDALPVRLKAFHFVNQSRIFNVGFSIIKGLLKEKLSSRNYFHGKDMKSLHKHIVVDRLPKQYGGNLDIPKVPGDEWCKYLKQCDLEFEAVKAYGYKNVKKDRKTG